LAAPRYLFEYIKAIIYGANRQRKKLAGIATNNKISNVSLKNNFVSDWISFLASADIDGNITVPRDPGITLNRNMKLYAERYKPTS
jgi:hypothetical protein